MLLERVVDVGLIMRGKLDNSCMSKSDVTDAMLACWLALPMN